MDFKGGIGNIKISKTYEYIPEWNDNRDSDNPVKMTANYLTTAQIERCMNIGSSNISIDRKQYLRESNPKFENLSVNDIPVCTADEFLKARGLGPLFSEVTTHILEQNNQGIGKN